MGGRGYCHLILLDLLVIAQIRPEVPSTVTHVILFVRDRPLVPTAIVYAIGMVVDPNIRAHMPIR